MLGVQRSFTTNLVRATVCPSAPNFSGRCLMSNETSQQKSITFHMCTLLGEPSLPIKSQYCGRSCGPANDRLQWASQTQALCSSSRYMIPFRKCCKRMVRICCNGKCGATDSVLFLLMGSFRRKKLNKGKGCIVLTFVWCLFPLLQLFGLTVACYRRD